ncbi:MAG: AGE family epimerase/isomerase, partial [Planctomycetes bacterium]|nr:AGE family epimerase/isomerase [Planctomycetota bacterium]
ERIVRLIDELLVLFDQHFYRGDGTLREYFGNSWHLDENRGHEVEAGHHFEWAWLLAECAELLDRPHLRDVAHDLYRWGERYGWDQVYGGYFDALDNHGALHIATKRIWPLCEAIKAAARLGEGHLVRNVNFLNLHYCVDGAWREHLYRNLGLMTEHLPATTLYHLTFAMSEVKKAANHG